MKENKKNILINFGPLKKGGGQNVALNFIQALQRKVDVDFEFYFIVCESSLLLEVLKKSKWSDRLLVVSSNPIKRILQEMSAGKRFIENCNIGLVYTYFGFGFFGKNVKQVIGSADSNLYFPEIDFWHTETAIERVKRFLVDKYRVYGLKLSVGVIFENKAMYERADFLYNIRSKKLILPSIDEPDIKQDLAIELKCDSLKILMLCGWQRNKNILLIPELANKLRDLGANIEFIITVEKDESPCCKEFFNLVEKWNAYELITCIGAVSKSQLPDLYEKIDLVLLLSLLESFSNNIIESWYFHRPLIISDELWSRAICSDAAYYVSRNDVGAIANLIMKVSESKENANNMIDKGKEALSQFPDINMRLDQELKFLGSVYD